jgi:glycosyltransferase involved in cell wall biosynthesis
MNMAKALALRGDIDLHVVTLSPWVRGPQSFVHPDGYTVHVGQLGIPLLHRGFPAYMPLDALSGYCRERRLLVNMVREIRPDVVHAHGTEYAYGLGALDAGFPWLVSMQGIIGELQYADPKLLYRVVAKLEQKVVRSAVFVGGRTHFDQKYVKSINPSVRWLDLPEAINTCYFESPWMDLLSPKILFAGSYAKHKGLMRLIEALGLLSGKYPELELHIAGNGSSAAKATVQDMVRRAKIHCTQHGFLQPHQIARLHRNCMLFVLPSENDNSPNALLEAMASGMPCIAYDVGGVASLLNHEKSGLLVSAGNIKELAASIDRLLQSSALRIRLGSAARLSAARNRPDLAAAVTASAYETVWADWR